MGNVEGAIDARTSIAGFFRRSFCQLYHSLTDEVMVAGRPAVAGCPGSSTRSVSCVGPQVLDRNVPVPRKVLWYQGQSLVSVLNADTWKPTNPPPFCTYDWKAERCAAVCG